MARLQTFEDWLVCVDHHLIMHTGMGVEDLPDMDYRAFYEDGLDPDDVLDIIEDEF